MIVGITTSPRKPSTLIPCLDSLIRAGWKEDEIFIFAEPNVPEAHLGNWWPNDEKLGCFHNWVNCARNILDIADQKNDPLVMTVQDDTIFHPESKEFAESLVWPSPKAAFISLYTPKHYSDGMPVGVNKLTVRNGLWGAQANLWNKDILREVLDTQIFKNWKGYNGKQEFPNIKNVDTAMGRAINFLGYEMYFIDPSPVQHVGATSTIGHGSLKGKRSAARVAHTDRPLKDQVFPKVNKNELGEEIKGTNACYYLGEVLKFERDYFRGGKEGNKPLAPVFSCSKFGECTLKRIDKSSRARCVACKHYRPTGNLVRLGHDPRTVSQVEERSN